MIHDIQQTDDAFAHTDVFLVAEEQDFVTIDDTHDFLDAVMIDISDNDILDAVTIDMDTDSGFYVSLDEEVFVSDFTTDEHYHSEIMNIDLFDDMSFA